MSNLILPDCAVHAAELEAALERLERVRVRAGWLKHFDSELRQIDGCLSLVKAKENALSPGMIPGYWHIKRDNPTTIPTVLPIQGPRGEFIEPHSGILEDLRRLDLQRDGALDELRRAQAKEVEDNRKGSELKQQERIEEMATRIKAYDSPGVSMADTGWTQSKQGRRGRR